MVDKKKQLIKRLKEISADYEGDPEEIHVRMDDALIEYIDDAEVTDLYNSEVMWYG